MEEIIGHLTRPLNDEEQVTGLFTREKTRLIGPDTRENIQKYFDDRFWSDQLPIIMPTQERVDRMLAETSHPRDEVVGSMRVTGVREAWDYTVETVAINAVMAGAKPEYFPAILALAASRTNATDTLAQIGVPSLRTYRFSAENSDASPDSMARTPSRLRPRSAGCVISSNVLACSSSSE